MKQPGSLIFNTNEIKTDEYVLLAKVFQKDGYTPKEASITIAAIDDMLCMQKISSIITSQSYTRTGKKRKNSSLKDLMERRIELLIEELKN